MKKYARPTAPGEPRGTTYATASARLPLTDRQRAVLLFIRSFVAEHGFPPAIGEIGRAFNIASPNGVVAHLDALIARGLIAVAARSSRGIRLVGAKWQFSYTPDADGERLRRAMSGEES